MNQRGIVPLIVGLVVLLATPAFAAERGPVLVEGLQSSKSYLLHVDASGNVTLRELPGLAVVRPGDAPDPGPGPNGNGDPPPDPTSLRGMTRAWAEAVTGDPNREDTAGEIATTYQFVRSRVASEQMTPQQALDFAAFAQDTILTGDRAEAWSDFRMEVSRELNRRLQSGDLASSAAWADAFGEIADGLRDVAGEQAVEEINVDRLLRLLELLLKLWEMFGGGPFPFPAEGGE